MKNSLKIPRKNEELPWILFRKKAEKLFPFISLDMCGPPYPTRRLQYIKQKGKNKLITECSSVILDCSIEINKTYQFLRSAKSQIGRKNDAFLIKAPFYVRKQTHNRKVLLSVLSFAISNKEYSVLILVKSQTPGRSWGKLCFLLLEKSISTHRYYILPAMSNTQTHWNLCTCY